MAFRSLLTALLLSSAAVAEAPQVKDSAAAKQQMRESLAHIQQSVAKARDERHPVKLTCAANAEEQLSALIESNATTPSDEPAAESARRAAEMEAAVNECFAREDRREAPQTIVAAFVASLEIPLFSDPPVVSFNRPVR